MPIITLCTSHPLHDTTSAALAQELSRITGDILKKKLPLTAVAIQPPATAWFIGNQALSPAECTALVEIRITAGTNTAEQKADWIDAVWQALQSHLPLPLSPISYINIIEIPAGHWGYGGLTQAARAAIQART